MEKMGKVNDSIRKNVTCEWIVKRWRLIRDCFKKEFNKEMRALSGSGGRRSRYKYAQALSFFRSTILSRSTVGSTREPAAELNPSAAIPQESATAGHFDSPGPSAPSQPSLTSDLSVPSTSAGASWPAALHESAGEDIAFPLPHPSDAATSTTPVALGWQRQMVLAPECILPELSQSFVRANGCWFQFGK
ncbi:uncharacterized protein LOC143804798 [Ranitomeya variabilis]|uniref:uncharacterized protein LOC143804798 n=1 Tax=Ranitomeya variabilis TaxID=490064 RepID=UPI0040561332